MAELSPEFSRPMRLDTLGEVPRAERIAANDTERAALKARFGLRAIDRLEAEAMLVRIGDAVDVEGRIRASVVQACVASGEDVPEAIDEPFAIRFVPGGTAAAPDEDIELEEAALDEITYAGGSVDLGEAVAQTLALALNPYPRAADADAILRDAGVKREGEALGPGALAGLKDLFQKE